MEPFWFLRFGAIEAQCLTFTGRVFLDQFWSYSVHFRPGAFSSFLESSGFWNPIHLYIFALGILRFLQTQFICCHLWILRFLCNPIHLLLPWIPQVSATQVIPFVFAYESSGFCNPIHLVTVLEVKTLHSKLTT